MSERERGKHTVDNSISTEYFSHYKEQIILPVHVEPRGKSCFFFLSENWRLVRRRRRRRWVRCFYFTRADYFRHN